MDHSQVPGITDTILQRPQSEMKERAEQLAAESPGDIIKLSVRVNSVMDSAALLQLTKHITSNYLLAPSTLIMPLPCMRRCLPWPATV